MQDFATIHNRKVEMRCQFFQGKMGRAIMDDWQKLRMGLKSWYQGPGVPSCTSPYAGAAAKSGSTVRVYCGQKAINLRNLPTMTGDGFNPIYDHGLVGDGLCLSLPSSNVSIENPL